MAATPKIVQLLKALPEKEFRRFKVYLQSPFFNKNPKLIQLLKARKSEGEDLEILQKKIFPKTEMSKQVFKNLSSALLKHYERFLAHLQLEDDEPLTKILAAEKAATWGKSEVVLAVSPKIELEEIGRFSFMAIQLLPRCFNRQVEASYQMKHYENCFPKWILSMEDHLIKLSFSLSYFFMANGRLNFENKHLNCPKYIFTLYQNLDSSYLLTDHYLLNAYRLCFELNHRFDYVDYQSFKKDVYRIFKDLHIQHSSELFINLTNICINQFEMGEDHFEKEYIELELKALKNGIGDISNSRLRNLIIMACNVKQFTTCYEVLDEYEFYMNKDTYRSSLSIIKFYEYKPKESLISIESTSEKYKGGSFVYRQLSMGCSILLSELAFTISLYESTRQYLERNKKNIGKHSLIPAKTYLKYFHKILKIRQQKEVTSHSAYQESLQKLKEEIQAVDKILSRNQLVFIIERLLEQ